MVGKHLMFNAHAETFATFEQPLNEYKSIQVTRIVHDFYDADPARGFYGGGGLDARMMPGPILYATGWGLSPETPLWGSEYKRALREGFTHTMEISSAGTSLALESNNITLDPQMKDPFGRPAIRVTYRDHPDDLAMIRFLQQRAEEILEAAGAKRTWSVPISEATNGVHLLGTCRMGDDPRTSVVDRWHRTHDVPNLFVCDGSSMVTSGRGQPTMTIQALAFRAGEHIAAAARAGEI
jgi:choline dehydrogenase-like flavoprotein